MKSQCFANQCSCGLSRVSISNMTTPTTKVVMRSQGNACSFRLGSSAAADGISPNIASHRAVTSVTAICREQAHAPSHWKFSQQFDKSDLLDLWRGPMKINSSCQHTLYIFVAISCLIVSPLFVSSANASFANPVPYVSQPLLPAAVAPGGSAFTLTVNGTGFVPTSVVRWNDSDRPTQFLNQGQLIATISAPDIAKAGTASITVFSPAPGGGSSAPVFFPVAIPEASPTMQRSDITTPYSITAVATADFNGDGKLDLATAGPPTGGNGAVRIFLRGGGTFRPGKIYHACHANWIATGDFNGDTFVDLAVADAACSKVSIFLGNGDGTFTEAASLSTGTSDKFSYSPVMVAVGDFNADGKLDLVTADSVLNKVSVFLGNGDGTFQDHVDFDSVTNSRKVVTGDFNGDGRLDLAVSSGGDPYSRFAKVSILLGNGDGTFQPQVQYQVFGYNTSDMIAADLNGDGNLDLLGISKQRNKHDFILFGNGDGTFRTTTIDLGGGSGPLVVADFNGDGILDLARSSNTLWSLGGILVQQGRGDGTFANPYFYAHPDGPTGLVAGDFNGDGRLDVAVGGATGISVFSQTHGGATSIQLSGKNLDFGVQTVGTTSAPQIITLTNVGPTPATGIDIELASYTNDFAQTNDCGSRLAVGASCTVSATFTPTATGGRYATVFVSDGDGSQPQMVFLSGSGT